MIGHYEASNTIKATTATTKTPQAKKYQNSGTKINERKLGTSKQGIMIEKQNYDREAVKYNQEINWNLKVAEIEEARTD